jgi:predicted nucleic acid-binding protein
LPGAGAISVVTVAELYLGVLMADDLTTRAQRLRTLSSVESLFEPLPIDADVTRAFAELVAEARRQGRRPKVMDTWIAATAVAHGLPVYTQDDDFLAIPRARIVKVVLSRPLEAGNPGRDRVYGGVIGVIPARAKRWSKV